MSLRRVAREAGVSSGAPYHHFTDRAALLAALSTEGFRLLAADLTTAGNTAPTPVAALTAMGAAYVQFAIHRPGYFRLMFRPELSQPDKHPDTRVAGEAAFGVLTDAVADCVAAGDLAADRAETVAVTEWALGHDIAALWLDGQLDKRSAMFGTSATELVDSVLGTITGPLSAPRRPDGWACPNHRHGAC